MKYFYISKSLLDISIFLLEQPINMQVQIIYNTNNNISERK